MRLTLILLQTVILLALTPSMSRAGCTYQVTCAANSCQNCESDHCGFRGKLWCGIKNPGCSVGAVGACAAANTMMSTSDALTVKETDKGYVVELTKDAVDTFLNE